MSEIDTSGGGKGKKKGPKKQSVRVDFTPMVDLGFLLITFFMLTTSMNKPQTMEINMPTIEKPVDPPPVKASQAITLLLAENNRVVYYFVNQQGEPEPPVVTDYSPKGIRETLLKENRKRNPVGVDSIPILKKMFQDKKLDEVAFKKRLSTIKNYKDGLIVVIKADDKSKYKNLVDILDEMLICSIGRYAVIDITPVEVEMLKTVKL